LIRTQENFSASIVRKLSIEAFTISNIIWLALVRMLSHANKYQKMILDFFKKFKKQLKREKRFFNILEDMKIKMDRNKLAKWTKEKEQQVGVEVHKLPSISC